MGQENGRTATVTLCPPFRRIDLKMVRESRHIQNEPNYFYSFSLVSDCVRCHVNTEAVYVYFSLLCITYKVFVCESLVFDCMTCISKRQLIDNIV